jgi:hypothetical protein
VAAYFYLRVAVLMYAGGGLGDAEAEGVTGGSAALGAGDDMTGGGTITVAGAAAAPEGGLAWATPASVAATVTTVNEQILLAGEVARAVPAGEVAGDEVADATDQTDASDSDQAHATDPAAAPGSVAVPALSGLAIALCTGVTVLFGVWPQPLIDFANHATLLFLPK